MLEEKRSRAYDLYKHTYSCSVAAIILGFQPGNSGSSPDRSVAPKSAIGERAMKKEYETVFEDLKEKRVLKVGDKKEIEVKYEHRPNVVGPRSKSNGLPIWVGETTATGNLDGGTEITAQAKCWLKEPYDYSQARVVATGRLLKQLGLPTSLAEQVKD